MDEQIEFSARASLVVLGLHMQRMGLWAVIAEHVAIKQKVLRHTPLDKLLDCFITILAGGVGLVELNTRVRPDRAVMRSYSAAARMHGVATSSRESQRCRSSRCRAAHLVAWTSGSGSVIVASIAMQPGWSRMYCRW